MHKRLSEIESQCAEGPWQIEEQDENKRNEIRTILTSRACALLNDASKEEREQNKSTIRWRKYTSQEKTIIKKLMEYMSFCDEYQINATLVMPNSEDHSDIVNPVPGAPVFITEAILSYFLFKKYKVSKMIATNNLSGMTHVLYCIAHCSETRKQ